MPIKDNRPSATEAMMRVLIIAILLICVGALLHPFLFGSKGSANTGPSAAVADAVPLPPTTGPAEEFKILRGKSGFWRVGKTESGVWWYVSPSDHREFLNTVTTVQPFQQGRDSDGPHFVSRD